MQVYTCEPETYLMYNLNPEYMPHVCTVSLDGQRARSRGRKATLPSNPLPVLEEDVGERHHCHRQEGQDARRPLVAKLFVHLDPEKGESR